MSDNVEPMQPLDPDHDGESEDVTDVGLPVDPADPLKRDDEEDMPGLDPTPPPLPSD